MLSSNNRSTLELDEERHLYIRLFKDDDPSRQIRRPFRILSGSMHYFRVHPQQWPERIAQMKRAGLNTIETYIPWNLHEPIRGVYQFNEGFSDLASFLKLVHENEMFTIVRPSGYICAEWEWGGLPSWLLADPAIRIRSVQSGFIEAIREYYAHLLPILAEHQYNRNGPGSIIAFQIENEYGSYDQDVHYLEALQSMYIQHDLDELFFTSDGAGDLARGALEDVWTTVNFQRSTETSIGKLLEFRPKHHLMIAEYWTGWFDYWGGKHKTGADFPYGTDAPYLADEFERDLEKILLQNEQEISINLYMFFGGTNFGFTSGAHHFPTSKFSPLVTSYDYDAPMTEAGDPSPKYYAVQRVLAKFYEKYPNLLIYNHPRTSVDKFEIETPTVSAKVAFGSMPVIGYKTFEQILEDDLLAVQTDIEKGPLNMESIHTKTIPHGLHQGFIVYTSNEIEKHFENHQERVMKITQIADNAIIMVNDRVIYASNHTDNEFEVTLPNDTKKLVILVENMGRMNFGPSLALSQKGILGKVLLDFKLELTQWKIHGLEFRKGMSSITGWNPLEKIEMKEQTNNLSNGPRIFNIPFEITEEKLIADTYLSLNAQWTKGVAFINGFNLGRYWKIGPQRTLYIPKELLVKGFNQIQIFELYTWGGTIELVDVPVINA